jgi:hypothetical protein
LSEVLKKDLEYVLPTMKAEDRVDETLVLAALEALIPERKGAYTLGEVRAQIKDNDDYQCARIQRISTQVATPVEFSDDLTWMKFRIVGRKTYSVALEASEWSDKSDDWVQQEIQRLMRQP